MYFIPQKNNRFYAWAVRKRPLYRYTITVCVAGIIILGWFYGMYGWVEKVIDERQKEVERMQEQCMQLTHSRAMCCQLVTRVQEMREKMRTQVMHETVQRLFHDYAMFVLDSAKKTGLRLTSYSSFSCKDQGWCVKNAARFNFQGNFVCMTRFFDTLKKSKKMIECKNIALTRIGRDLYTIAVSIDFSAIKKEVVSL